MYASGVVMVKGLFAARVCAMLLFVLVYSVSFSYSAEAGNAQDAGFPSSAAGFVHHGILTEKEKRSIVTIEFNCTVIDTKNRTALNFIYRSVHKAILDVLNRRKSNMTTVPPSTALFATTPTSTMSIPTTIPTTTTTTTQGVVDPSKKKKKRKKRVQKMSVEYEATDLHFVEINPEIDENGILRMSLLLLGKGFDDHDCGMTLFKAVNQTKENGTLDRVAGVPVVAIYKGLPANRGTMSTHNHDHRYLIWPLVIMFIILLFVVIGCFIYWKRNSHKTKAGNNGSQRK